MNRLTLNGARRRVEDLDAPEAMTMLHALMERFGWAGTVMTRGDAEGQLERALTDEEWATVRHTRSWRKAGELWNEVGITWQSLDSALEEAGLL